jgi:hypothetical protein
VMLGGDLLYSRKRSVGSCIQASAIFTTPFEQSQS